MPLISTINEGCQAKIWERQPQIWSEFMFDVDAPACVTVGNPVVPVVGLVFNAKNNNSTVL